MLSDLGTPDELITTVLDSSSVLELREQAIALHASQLSPYEAMPAGLRHDFLTVERLRRMVPDWGGGPGRDRHLRLRRVGVGLRRVARSTRRKPPPELDEFLSPFDEALVETVLRLRDRVLTVMPNAHEVVWDAVNAVSIAFTPTTRWQDGICHIADVLEARQPRLQRGRVAIPTQWACSKGTGNHIRHVTFRTPDDASPANAPWIDDYLRTAMKAAGMKPDEGDRGVTIRIMKGKKRRPS